MNKDIHQLCKRFDRVAEIYDDHAAIHQKMAYRLLYQVKHDSVKHILEIGCHTGFLTQLLLDRLPHAVITAVSVSERMVNIAKEKINEPNRVRWVICDYTEVDAILQNQRFDMIISNATLHWMDNPEQEVEKYYQMLEPGGSFLASALGTDTLQELRKVFQITEQGFGFPSEEHILVFSAMQQWEEWLSKSGFQNVSTLQYWLRPEASNCKELLHIVKNMGESCHCSRQSFYTSFQVMSKVIKKYNRAYRSREGVYATVHVNQFVAHKAHSIPIVQ